MGAVLRAGTRFRERGFRPHLGFCADRTARSTARSGGASLRPTIRRRADKIIADINFDFMAPEKQTKILMSLRSAFEADIRRFGCGKWALKPLRSMSGVKILDMTGFMEFIERAMQIPPPITAHSSRRAFPLSISWDRRTTSPMRWPIITTRLFDTVEALHPESFEAYGGSMERLIRSLNALQKFRTIRARIQLLENFTAFLHHGPRGVHPSRAGISAVPRLAIRN